MAKDYRRKPSTPRQSSSFSKQLLLVLVCFLCGYLSATVFDFASVSQWVNKQVIAQISPQTLVKPIPQQVQLPKPKLEFYTLLTKDQRSPKASAEASSKVVSAEPNLKSTTTSSSGTQTPSPNQLTKVTSEKLNPASTPGDKNAYLVQIASFKSRQEAERMKASLALKGFVVSIAVVNQQQTQWYRIILGPYASRTQAEKARSSIAQSEHLAGMIRRMEG